MSLYSPYWEKYSDLRIFLYPLWYNCIAFLVMQSSDRLSMGEFMYMIGASVFFPAKLIKHLLDNLKQVCVFLCRISVFMKDI